MQVIASCLLTVSLAFFCPGTFAQVDEIETGFAQLGPGEEQRLRAILAEPVPQGALLETLRRHFGAKNEAALRLEDMVAREANLREQVRLVPDAASLVNLGWMVLRRGAIDEGNAYVKEAIQKGNLQQKALFTASFAHAMYQQYRDADARALMSDARRMVGELETLTQTDYTRVLTSRSKAMVAMTESLLEERSGRFANAISAAVQAEQPLRRAMSIPYTSLERAYVAHHHCPVK